MDKALQLSWAHWYDNAEKVISTLEVLESEKQVHQNKSHNKSRNKSNKREGEYKIEESMQA